MSKRGQIEAIILAVVLGVAVVGGYFAAQGPGQATAFNFECIIECQPPKAVDSVNLVTTSAEEAQFMCNTMANERCSPGTRYRSIATGYFAVPSAREYGGAIRGISVPGTRAFPAGRAFETPDENCYTCSCLTQGITALDEATAARVCSDNCGGSITSSRTGYC